MVVNGWAQQYRESFYIRTPRCSLWMTSPHKGFWHQTLCLVGWGSGCSSASTLPGGRILGDCTFSSLYNRLHHPTTNRSFLVNHPTIPNVTLQIFKRSSHRRFCVFDVRVLRMISGFIWLNLRAFMVNTNRLPEQFLISIVQ